MVLPKSKNAVGLGNSLMNDRFGKGKGSDMRRGNHQDGIKRVGQNGETYVTNNKKSDHQVKMNSVTEQAALDEFLSTAELAGTDFTAEKMSNVKIIHTDQRNPFLLSAAEERAAVRKQNARRDRLTVPRRPPWDENTTAQQLDEREREALLEWRRGLAVLQEGEDLLMTPFERNLEVWRQLWRVIERSDLVVQIVDARNPLLFRSEDLERYVKEVDPKKNNLLLVNKADMMTLEQRKVWARYFDQAGINYRFFSAELAKLANESGAYDSESDEDSLGELGETREPSDQDSTLVTSTGKLDLTKDGLVDEDERLSSANAQAEADADPTRIATTDDLEALFLKHAPKDALGPESAPRRMEVGLVGYPNVGKSSTINALIGAKKVSVSATPGKTKHFQTIHLSPSIVLCDCPGLVFPNFASTRAELVVNGVLPIDQLREYTGPAGLVAKRVPQAFIEAMYGIRIRIRPLDEGGTSIPTASELLSAYAAARGFVTTGKGQPDESRAARTILKDYVKGKLLFCHPPPVDPPLDPLEFNAELYDDLHLPLKRRAAAAVQASSDNTNSSSGRAAAQLQRRTSDTTHTTGPLVQGEKSQNLDTRFFARGQGSSSGAGHLSTPWQRSYSEVGLPSGKQLNGRKMREMVALDRNVDPADVVLGSGKKHYKGNKRKAKRVEGYE